MDIIVLTVELECDLLVLEDVLVDVDVVAQGVLGDDVPEVADTEEDVVPQAMLGGEVLEPVDADVVEEVGVHEEVLGS
eukprot:5506048-Amphidinium_carterae.1